MNHSYIRNISVSLLVFLLGMWSANGQETLIEPVNEVNSHSAGDNSQNPFSSASTVSISGNELMEQYFGSIGNALNGKLLGLIVTEDAGEPGSLQAGLSIRGYGNYYTRDIKIYIDGFEAQMSYLESLSPGEIDQITVLKDAASLATFGMNGANGVLWVTTKRGEAGNTKVNFRLKSGTQKPTLIYKPLRSYDYASLYNEAVSNDNGMVWSTVYSDVQLAAYQNGTGIDVDWYDESLKDMGNYTDGNLSFSGGDRNTRFFMDFGFLNNQGIYKVPTNDETANALQNKYNVRLNLDFMMFSIVEGQVDVSGIVDDRKSPIGSEWDLWSSLANYPSNIYPVQNDESSWTGTTTYPNNPVARINAQGYNSTHDRTLQGRMKLREDLSDITPGLFAEQSVYFNTWTRGTYNRTRNYERVLDGVVQTADLNTNYSVYDDNGTNQWNTKQLNAKIGYNRAFGSYTLNGGVTYLLENTNVDGNLNGAAGVQTIYNYQNLGGFMNYSLKQKYIAEFGFALSGSDNYIKGNRWGLFPTLSLAWDAKKEDFLQNADAITALYVRASAGQTATDETPFQRYLYMKYYTGNGNFRTGNSSIVDNYGSQLAYTPNVNIFVEKSLKYNIGIDAELFNLIGLTLEGFVDKRSGIVTPVADLPAVYGINAPYLNAGEVTVNGLEAMLNISNKLGDFSYSLTGMVVLTNSTIDYNGEVDAYINAPVNGNPIGARFGYEADGFYGLDDFNADGTLNNNLPVPTFGSVQPGDIKYLDIETDGIIDAADRVLIGKDDFPTTTYSIQALVQFKGLDLKVMVQGLAGREINLLDISSRSIPFANNNNAHPIIENRWAYFPEQGIDTRESALYPRLSSVSNSNNSVYSDFWQKNGSFLKLRNVEMGYNLPVELTRKMKLENVRLFVTGHNLFSSSWLEKNYGIDPEFISGYPSMKSISLGININL